MPLFASPFKKPNPTGNWVADPFAALDLDLSHHSLNGVALGAALDRLSFLGLGEPCAGEEANSFKFASKGLIVDADDSLRIEGFVVFLCESEEDKIKPFPGKTRYKGKTIPLGRETTEEQIVELFGEPYWRDQDEDETLLFYEFGPVEWQIELTPHAGVQAMIIGRPLLADPEQRKAYRVSKPWPPNTP